MGAPKKTGGLSRRSVLGGLAAAGGAAGVAPAAAAPGPSPSPRPGPARPVRALYEGMPYFDFNGAAPAVPQKARPQIRLEDLPAETRWLLGLP